MIVKDDSFVRDLLNSLKPVVMAAWYLNSHGWNIEILPIRIGTDPLRKAEFSDNGDLMIWMDDSKKHRVEVRHTSKVFSNLETYPYESVMVDASHKIDKADPPPYVWMVFNKDLTGFLRIRWQDRDFWEKRKYYDKYKGRERWSYFTDRDTCKYFEVEPMNES